MEKGNLRHDIQGLRALAALSVVIFHITPQDLTGGYLGVDIFFVISGYLIMGQIWRSLEKNRFNFADFYVRRFRRLLPALLLVIVASSIPAYYLLLPSEFQNYGVSVFSALFYFSNFWFYTKSGYFDTELQTAPLLHTWSLSVEEQFYFFFPFLLFLIYRFCSSTKKALVLLIGIAITSLVLSELLVNHNQSLSFYASPTRFWQFIAGGVISISNIHPPRGRLGQFLSLIGLAILVYVLAFFSEDTKFPGVSAIPVTAASALVIYAASKRGLASWILSNPISNYFGNISYSLYLWHWPAITFYKIYLFEKSVEYGTYLNAQEFVAFDSFDKAAVFVASIVLADLTYRFIEVPMKRKKLVNVGYKPIFVALLASLLVTGSVTGSAYLQRGGFTQQTQLYDSYLGYRNPNTPDGCFLHSKRNDFELFDQQECIRAEPQMFNILLIGDSHAEHWASALKANLRENQTLSYATASGCRPILPLKGTSRCTELMDWAFKLIEKGHFNKIVLGGRWLMGDIPHIADTVDLLRQSASIVQVMGPVIEYQYPLSMLLAKFGDNPSIMQFANYDESRQFSLKVAQATAQGGGEYFSTLDYLCQADGICQFINEQGIPIQYDYGHLTHEGALMLLGEAAIRSPQDGINGVPATDVRAQQNI